MESLRAFQSGTASNDEMEPNRALPEPVRAVSRLRELPPSPFRSLGKHLDYADWPDRQRFMELDRDIQREAQEGRRDESCADPDEFETLDRTKLVA